MTEAAAPRPSGGRVGGAPLRAPLRLLPDERLARRAAAGDERAFEEIFRRYHQDLYRFCLATVSNPQDAQEALQNTMVKVMRALPGEEREIKLKPWLYRIARNEAVETIRKRRDSAQLAPERMAAPWEIAETAAARERLRRLFADLVELPERQRGALLMRELGGLDFEEIGEAFGTSSAVARQTLYEARQSLRHMEEGREMSCALVQQALSDADGRVTRRRDVRAHLRGCAGCRAFREDIGTRRADLAAIAPLPLAVSGGLLGSVLGGGASAAAGTGVTAGAVTAAGGSAGLGGAGLAGTLGMGAGKAIGTSAAVKSVATVTVVAAVGASAADRGGVIDLPLPGGNGPASKPEPARSDASNRVEGGGSPAPLPLGSPPQPARPVGDGAGTGPSKGAAVDPQSGVSPDVHGSVERPGRSSKPSRATAPNGVRGGRTGDGKPKAPPGGPPPDRGKPPAAGGGGSTGRAHGSPPVRPKPEPAGQAPAAPAVPSPQSSGGAARPEATPSPEAAPEPDGEPTLEGEPTPPVTRESTPAAPPTAAPRAGGGNPHGAAGPPVVPGT